MQSPIGGPRFWRRLVSRWWQPVERMQREWDERARTDPQGYIGRGYAASDDRFWASGSPDLEGLILDGLDLDPRAAVLEIGCGVGRLLRPLAARAARVIGVDIAPAMVAQGRTLLADLPQVSLQVTQGRFDGIADASLDLVYSFAVFQHIPAKSVIAGYIDEAARVLRGGGILKIQVDGRRRSFWRGSDTWLGAWYTRAEIESVLAARGFAIADTWGEATQYFWITAVRSAGPGRADTALARVRPVRWNEPAVTALLARLGPTPASALSDLLANRSTLRDLTGPFLRRQRPADDAAFVAAAFNTLLGRAGDAEGLAFYAAELRRGATRAYVLDCLLASAEMRRQLRVS